MTEVKRASGNPVIPEGINTSSDNPLKEFAILSLGIGSAIIISIIVIALLVEKLAVYIPFSWEEKIATVAAAQLQSNEPTLSDSLTKKRQLAEQAVKNLSQSIANNAELPKAIQLHFHLIDQPIPNAFATLGGHIFITEGLLTHVDTENALAMVIAHEIAHIKYRHPVQALGRGAVIQIIFAFVFGSQDSSMVQGVFGSGGLLTLLSFNRAMEREADDDALKTIKRLYGHTFGADYFFNTMLNNRDEKEWLEIFQTHPITQSRIEKIKKEQQHLASNNYKLTPLDPAITDYVKAMKAPEEIDSKSISPKIPPTSSEDSK